MRQFRVSFTVKGEDRLGTVLGVLARETTEIQIGELGGANASNQEMPSRRQRAHGDRTAWAQKYAQMILDILGTNSMHSKEIAVKMEKLSGGKLKATSVGPLLSALAKNGTVHRANLKGWYNSTGKLIEGR